jgi:hypothetical protein
VALRWVKTHVCGHYRRGLDVCTFCGRRDVGVEVFREMELR